MSGAYYNENDKKLAAWLRELMRCGLIAPGVVDERSIEDVKPCELREFTQCHFFAGIGMWSYALRLAGWPDNGRIWTGSCPCQPFSEAGSLTGFADERHLWPAWFHLIAQCRPDVVVGEQVASKAALQWLALVLADMEGASYACGAVDLPAASVGAPHGRQRILWVADADGERFARRQKSNRAAHYAREQASRRCDSGGRGPNAYAAARIVVGADGTGRAVEPGIQPMVDGHSGSVVALRAYGNSIVAPLAAEFIGAFLDARSDAALFRQQERA